MAKYSKKLARKIFDLIKRDSYTIAEICANVGISESCFYNWSDKIEEFGDGIARARENFVEARLVDCEKSLVKLINGYDYEEKKTIMVKNSKGEPSIKEQTVTKMHMPPSLPAIQHYQTNLDPENWKNRQSTELTGKGGKDLFEGVSDEGTHFIDCRGNHFSCSCGISRKRAPHIRIGFFGRSIFIEPAADSLKASDILQQLPGYEIFDLCLGSDDAVPLQGCYLLVGLQIKPFKSLHLKGLTFFVPQYCTHFVD